MCKTLETDVFVYSKFTLFRLLEFVILLRGVIEEDEVCSVARLLGDLVSYRASGTGHLEFLAG